MSDDTTGRRTYELTDALARELSVPSDGRHSVTYFDKTTTGFGLRVTQTGARSWVYVYRHNGKQHLFTIGQAKTSKDSPGFKMREARHEALRHYRKDPLAERKAGLEAQRRADAAETVADLVPRYLKEHAEPKKKARSIREDQNMIKQWIMPKVGKLKVGEITTDDVKKLHTEISNYVSPRTGKPTKARANATVGLLSSMFTFAVEKKMRPDNPCAGVKFNRMRHRQRYLDNDELDRLLLALAKHADKDAANVIRLLLLTGARKNEVMRATWSTFDLRSGWWRKPAEIMKTGQEHPVPLSPHALQLLRQLRSEAEHGEKRARALEARAKNEPDNLRRKILLERAALARLKITSDYVFPSVRREGQPLRWVTSTWQAVVREADLSDIKLHDLRHTFASLLLREGLSLPVIARLLGHSQVSTTSRYSHVADDVARLATTAVGQRIAAVERGTKGKVVKFKRR